MALPITKDQAHTAAQWVKGNFGQAIGEAVSGTSFSVDIICGIACQETAYFWLSFIDRLSVADILGRCVLDASGDFPNTRRSAFPRNTAAFRARFGDDFTQELIDEANHTRELRGFHDAAWVYKGYGIFQYDLQNILVDEPFFREKQWYEFSSCMAKVMEELEGKYAVQQDVWKAVRAYNGSGPSATDYANNVMQFASYSSQVT